MWVTSLIAFQWHNFMWNIYVGLLQLLSWWLKFGHCAKVQIFESCMSLWADESVQNNIDTCIPRASWSRSWWTFHSEPATLCLSMLVHARTAWAWWHAHTESETKGHTKFILLSLWPSSQWTLLRCSLRRYFRAYVIQSVETECWRLKPRDRLNGLKFGSGFAV